MRKSVIMSGLCLALLTPLPAMAYIGPGAGLSAIGSVFAFLGVIFLLIVGFIWYPIKRLFRGREDPKPTGKPAEAAPDKQ